MITGSHELAELIDAALEDLDMPEPVYRTVVARYEDVAGWLADYWPNDAADGILYPQGSFRLGTVISPVGREGQYDLDFVCRRDLLPGSLTQDDLKSDVGRGLRRYLATGAAGSPLSKGNRCWTLGFGDEPFHMDVLPALPDPDPTTSMNAILLTDSSLTRWQHSNPIDFAEWFHAQMRQEYVRLREVLAKRMDIDDIPAWRIKTTLQRAVQALKRHRDLYFAERYEDRAASIIVTTLAARAYTGDNDVYQVLRDVAKQMPDFIETRRGVEWIANPTLPSENFADRWQRHPERRAAFYEWIEQVQADIGECGQRLGLDAVLESIARSFGPKQALKAGAVLGSRALTARETGALGMTATGLLGPVTRRPIPQHTPHGGEFPHRRP